MHEINPFESIYMPSELDFDCEVKEGVTSNCPTLLLYTAERHPVRNERKFEFSDNRQCGDIFISIFIAGKI